VRPPWEIQRALRARHSARDLYTREVDLTNRVAVITGASRGLGAGIAEAAYERGMSVVLCSRSPPALPPGPRVSCMELDMAEPDATESLAREATARFEHVDLWINNAGLLEPVGPLRDAAPDALRRLFEVNVLGVALGCRAYLRLLHASGRRGVLLNISSGAARNPYAGWSGYCASKAAVDRLSEAIALEESDRVKIHSVAPGTIDTPMQALVRTKSADVFPAIERFRKLHADGELVPPRDAGHALLDLAFEPEGARDEVCIDLRD